MIVYYGKSSSGKSAVAENRAVSLAHEKNVSLIYLATMANDGSQAAKERILHHKSLREGKGFTTVEETLYLAKAYDKCQGSVVLLECISNLLANRQYKLFGNESMGKRQLHELVLELVDEIYGLSKNCCKLIVVTNDIFDSRVEDAWCDSYMQALGLINQRLAALADEVVEVSFGLCNRLK